MPGPGLRDRLERLLSHRRAPLAVVALTALLLLPSVRIGLFADDRVLLAEVEGRLPPQPSLEPYTFATGDTGCVLGATLARAGGSARPRAFGHRPAQTTDLEKRASGVARGYG
jgi:hypothetical protein